MLYGFKGCGKSYFGQKCAAALGWDFIDTDRVLEAKFGASIRELFLEGDFRKKEEEVLLDLKAKERSVIALGGGGIFFAASLNLGKLIYLKAEKATVKARLFQSTPLPAFIDVDAPEASFEKYYQERYPLYEQVGGHVLWVEGKHELEVVWEVIHLATSLKS